ncbi:MAG: hypothetical protein B0W54_04800 [Cellvibrio sp. 79]|nr:MAG: hypothetical protein B0W54_04800 [Cellvibrio sp. 79]
MSFAKVLETLEVTLLLEAIFQRFGNDYRNHDKDYIRGRLRSFMDSYAIATLSALQEKVLHDETVIGPLLYALDERKIGLFENAEQILKIRTVLIPWLRSCPAPKIWIAECAAAEEVYELAILLREENLHHKTDLYVTGPNANLLAEAKQGIFSEKLFDQYQKNYYRAGGNKTLLEYCVRTENGYVFSSELRGNITWSEYNLGTDSSPNEFEVIICCGGLSGFTLYLRHRALKIFYESQPMFGLLAIMGEGSAEVPHYTSHYHVVSELYGIYQRG